MVIGGIEVKVVDVPGLNVPLMVIVDGAGKVHVYEHGKKICARSIKFEAQVDCPPLVTMEKFVK